MYGFIGKTHNVLHGKIWRCYLKWGGHRRDFTRCFIYSFCVHASFMCHFSAISCEIASFAPQSTTIAHVWRCLLVRTGHSIWQIRGERWDTPFTNFAIMAVFWFFPGLWRLAGIVCLKLFHFGGEKRKWIVLILFCSCGGGRGGSGGDGCSIIPSWHGWRRGNHSGPSLWQKHSICKERRKSYHNDVWLFCLTLAAGPWDPRTGNRLHNGFYTNSQTPHY